MKKRITAIVLGTCVIAALITGCSNAGGSAANTPAGNTGSTANTAAAGQPEVYPETVAKNQTAANNENGQQAGGETSGGENSPAQVPQGGQTVQNNTAQGSITADEAKNIALNRAGIEEKDTISLVVKQDYDDGLLIYEVDLYTPDRDYEYEINAADGAIYDEDIEMADKLTTVMAETAVSAEDVKKTVLGNVPGATEDNLRLKMDFDDGRYTYEGEIIYDNTKYEFEIDAQTGSMYEWKQESLIH